MYHTCKALNDIIILFNIANKTVKKLPECILFEPILLKCKYKSEAPLKLRMRIVY